MTIVLVIAAWLFTALAALLVVANYVWATANWRNKRRGIDRHVSTVPVIVLICCGLASTLSKGNSPPFPPPLLFAALIVLDPSLWQLVALPFALLRRRGRS